MAITQHATMSYIENNKIDRLTRLYIHSKRNPKEMLNKEASEWRNHVCEPTPDDPYKVSLSFPEAYEKYILPEIPNKKREALDAVLKKIPEGKVPVITPAAEEELVVTASEYKLLLERLDQLELEVSMLRSQNAFAEVAGK